MLSREHPIIVVAEPGRGQEAATRLGRIGFDHVIGCLLGGINALESRPDLVEGTERITASAAAEEIASPSPPLILDVRAPREWQSKHIPGSLNIPLNHLRERVGELPRGRRILVHCAGGYRSSIAASILQQFGFEDLSELSGGIAAWEAAKLPVEA
jgi:rhodanese-related sulfurtransferase